MNVMKNKTYLKVGATSFNEVNWKRTCIDLINKHMKKIRNGNKVMQNQKPTARLCKSFIYDSDYKWLKLLISFGFVIIYDMK